MVDRYGLQGLFDDSWLWNSNAVKVTSGTKRQVYTLASEQPGTDAASLTAVLRTISAGSKALRAS